MEEKMKEVEKIYGQFESTDQSANSLMTAMTKLFFKTFLFTIFIVTGASKLMAGQLTKVIDFQTYGVPSWAMLGLGTLEICAATLILIPRTSLMASSLLCLVLLGATGTNLFTGEILRALVTSLLFGVCLWLTLNDSFSGVIDLELDKDFRDEQFAATDDSRHETKSAS